MKKTIVISLFSLFLFSNAAMAASSIKAEVNGMVCAFCAKGIEKKLRSLPAAQDVFIDLKQHIVVLELKDGQSVPIEQFRQIIKEAGYDVAEARLVDQSAASLRTEMAK
ncbi:heavy-metal-associated domain-containing protein [Methylobacillus flagellatus]|uniref:heavy-metal-associated domain-containing protein n=1 Tax=Methylobacillus flagellatus TaxID=405 RepID=UPI0010F5D01A|nr:heavy metal-associated domain-containing protein [Methylobacillus flagellatus]